MRDQKRYEQKSYKWLRDRCREEHGRQDAEDRDAEEVSR